MLELDFTSIIRTIITFFTSALRESARSVDEAINNFFSWSSDALPKVIEALWEMINGLVPVIAGSAAEFFLPFAQATNAILPDLSLFCGECFTIPEALSGLTSGTVISTGILGLARWVLPIDIAICIFAVFTTVLLLYFTLLPIFRWLKLVRG